ncbi:MAG: hypothetical protein AAF768_13695, partial [Pseudomonadota bacterium]
QIEAEHTTAPDHLFIPAKNFLHSPGRPHTAFGSASLFTVALLGVRTRRFLITYQIIDDHLGSQTLGASQFRSMQLRFTNAVCGLGLIRPLPLFLALSSQSLCPS